MKNKTILVVSIILSFFTGIIGTILVLHYFPLSGSSTVEKTVSEVNITESDSISKSIDKIYDSVVLIEISRNGTVISSGTGFIYKKDDKNYYIITNHHVVSSNGNINVTLTSGEVAEAKILGSDEYSDIAVLSIDKKYKASLASIGNSTSATLGDTVFTVGSPLGKDYMGTVTKGILSGKNRLISVTTNQSGSFVMEVLQTDAAINPGNSGGPLVNINGEVIGVTSIKLVQSEIEGMGFAIPIEMVMNYAEQLEHGETIKRPILGVELLNITDMYYLYRSGISIDKSIDKGVVIAGVEENTPASIAGLIKGDIILEIDGQSINDVGYFRYTLYKYKVGDIIKVKYYRKNEIKEVEIKLNKSV